MNTIKPPLPGSLHPDCSVKSGHERRKCEACGKTFSFHNWFWHEPASRCHVNWKMMTPISLLYAATEVLPSRDPKATGRVTAQGCTISPND